VTDTELLNWLEKQEGAALISDDFGHWAVTWDGMQSIPETTPADISTSFFIEKNDWHNSVRAAIKAAIEDEVIDRYYPGRFVKYAGSNYQVAEVKRFGHGYMIGIYDEPPSKHVDYLSPESVEII